MSFQEKDSQSTRFLVCLLLAATLEFPYLSTTKKEVKYCDHAIIIVSCVYIEFRKVVILIAILTIVWFLIYMLPIRTKWGIWLSLQNKAMTTR
jgi:hypothetical protein